MNSLKTDCKSLEEQLTNCTIENEKLRQKCEQAEQPCRPKEATKEVQTEIPMEDSTDVDRSSNNLIARASGCKAGMCIEDEDKYKFECNRCKKLFHYRFTNLPTYQITHFLTTNYRRYICINCTLIPDYIADITKDGVAPPPPPVTVTTDVVNDNDNLISSLKSFLTEQVSHIEKNLTDTIVNELGENKKELNALNENLKARAPVSKSNQVVQTLHGVLWLANPKILNQ